MKEKNKKTALKTAYVALFSALICVCSFVSFPLASGISVTLQTFAVLLSGAILGWKFGTLAVAVYIAIGAAGIPVFSGFRGGIGVLGGVTGGFIVGFLFTALIVGLAGKIFGMRVVPLAVSMILGITVCYAIGTAWYCVVYKGEKTFFSALSVCVLPYLPFDALKTAAAVSLSIKLHKYIGGRI